MMVKDLIWRDPVEKVSFVGEQGNKIVRQNGPHTCTSEILLHVDGTEPMKKRAYVKVYYWGLDPAVRENPLYDLIVYSEAARVTTATRLDALELQCFLQEWENDDRKVSSEVPFLRSEVWWKEGT